MVLALGEPVSTSDAHARKWARATNMAAMGSRREAVKIAFEHGQEPMMLQGIVG
jgi:hypothetical protein